MAIKVLQPGLATTVQDAGRIGYYHLGIPLSGALDQYSFRAANLLVGNSEDAATLEITMLGPKLEFMHDAAIALTGANLPAKLDGVPMPSNQAVAVKARAHTSPWRVALMCRRCLAVVQRTPWGPSVVFVEENSKPVMCCPWGLFWGHRTQAKSCQTI
jgi:allophanate hydrolase subunit 2